MPNPNSKGHTVKPIRKVAWSPDGKYIAAVDDNGTVLVWGNLNKQSIYLNTHHQAGGVVNTSDVSKARVNAIAWSCDSKYLAFASRDGTVRVWDTTAKNSPINVYSKLKASVNDVAWSCDSKYLAFAGRDGKVQILNTGDPKDIFSFSAHNVPIKSVAWSSNNNYIATASDDWTVKIWDASSWRPIYTYQAPHS